MVPLGPAKGVAFMNGKKWPVLGLPTHLSDLLPPEQHNPHADENNDQGPIFEKSRAPRTGASVVCGGGKVPTSLGA